ncbi:lysylphosphatidylglycerol synthase transmembrane domain-containing protein [Arsenicibacter rosenii]|uniref:TIGR00374 family protein n=1 Tax=Arsenicibacter rosenii TaxID=1750698 RepID=A0A1S2VEM9_9BACT|nr:lysylphosphatidylglycerol synthase transmembrane domain-containing protein [Arsenicibacter rosenii]OIN56358.1 hypothetical protein BLX24_25355 [Arsenicibacter rosenii]
MNKLFKRSVPLLLAVTLLVYALKDIEFSDFVSQFNKANYTYIVLVGIIIAVSYYMRGWRWQQPLLALGYTPTAFRATVAMQSGSVASMIVIGSGEVTRCLTLQRTDGVPFSQGVGSVVAERVVDLFMLVLILSLAFLLELARMQAYLAELTLKLPSALLIGLGLAGVLSLLVIWFVIRLPAVQNHTFMKKIIRFANGLWQGFSAIKNLPNPGLFVTLTVALQGMTWLATYLVLLSLDITSHLPPSAALTILAVSSIGGLAVPTQGGIGTFHFFVSRALVLYGLSTAEGAVVATFMHAIGFAINLVLSSISFLIIPVLIQRRNKEVALEAENEQKA